MLGDLFRDQISDEERKTVETYFAAIAACLRQRLAAGAHPAGAGQRDRPGPADRGSRPTC